MDKHLMQPADSRKEDQESEETKDEMEYGEIVSQTTKTPECRKSMEKLSKRSKTSTRCVTETLSCCNTKKHKTQIHSSMVVIIIIYISSM